MPLHPQPYGGDKPLGKHLAANGKFIEVFALFIKFSTQKEKLVAMMNQCDEGFCKELLQKQIKDHDNYIAEILEYLEMVAVKLAATKEAS
jgi:hypothetical protein